VVVAVSAAVGSPQAVLTEEDLAIKEAAKQGGGPLDASALRRSRSGSRSSRAAAAAGHLKKAQLSKSQRSGRHSDRQVVVPKEAKGMVLPFEPLSISFDDICYYVDMPAVSPLKAFISDFPTLSENLRI